jgi:hypothetical protein
MLGKNGKILFLREKQENVSPLIGSGPISGLGEAIQSGSLLAAPPPPLSRLAGDALAVIDPNQAHDIQDSTVGVCHIYFAI